MHIPKPHVIGAALPSNFSMFCFGMQMNPLHPTPLIQGNTAGTGVRGYPFPLYHLPRLNHPAVSSGTGALQVSIWQMLIIS